MNSLNLKVAFLRVSWEHGISKLVKDFLGFLDNNIVLERIITVELCSLH